MWRKCLRATTRATTAAAKTAATTNSTSATAAEAGACASIIVALLLLGTCVQWAGLILVIVACVALVLLAFEQAAQQILHRLGVGILEVIDVNFLFLSRTGIELSHHLVNFIHQRAGRPDDDRRRALVGHGQHAALFFRALTVVLRIVSAPSSAATEAAKSAKR